MFIKNSVKVLKNNFKESKSPSKNETTLEKKFSETEFIKIKK
jgi:hypothetical protein